MRLLTILFLGCLRVIVAQDSPQLTPAVIPARGILPSPLLAAPGELVTVIVQGVGGTVTKKFFAPGGMDMPVELAGIQAAWLQIGDNPFADRPSPILSVLPVYTDPNALIIFSGTKLL